MRRPALRAALIALVAGAPVLGGCGSGSAGLSRTASSPTPIGISVMRYRVLEAVQRAGLEVEHNLGTGVVARLDGPSGAVRVRVRYDARRYLVDVPPGDVGGPEYEALADRLAAELDRSMGLSARAEPPPSALAGGLDPPVDAPAGDSAARTIERSTRPLWEAAIPGLIVFVGSWVASWASSIAGGGPDPYLGMSFVPIVGPWTQIGWMNWSHVPRWTGIVHPLLGLAQLAGLGTMLVGLVVPVHVTTDRTPELEVGLGPVFGGASVDLRLRF